MRTLLPHTPSRGRHGRGRRFRSPSRERARHYVWVSLAGGVREKEYGIQGRGDDVEVVLCNEGDGLTRGGPCGVCGDGWMRWCPEWTRLFRRKLVDVVVAETRVAPLLPERQRGGVAGITERTFT